MQRDHHSMTVEELATDKGRELTPSVFWKLHFHICFPIWFKTGSD